jgi:hypothetical protein
MEGTFQTNPGIRGFFQCGAGTRKISPNSRRVSTRYTWLEPADVNFSKTHLHVIPIVSI